MREVSSQDVLDIIKEVAEHGATMNTFEDKLRSAMVEYIEKREHNLQAEVRRLTQECNRLSAHVKALEGACTFKNWEIARAELKAARNVQDYGAVCVEYRIIKEKIASAINKGKLPSDFWSIIADRNGANQG